MYIIVFLTLLSLFSINSAHPKIPKNPFEASLKAQPTPNEDSNMHQDDLSSTMLLFDITHSLLMELNTYCGTMKK